MRQNREHTGYKHDTRKMAKENTRHVTHISHSDYKSIKHGDSQCVTILKSPTNITQAPTRKRKSRYRSLDTAHSLETRTVTTRTLHTTHTQATPKTSFRPPARTPQYPRSRHATSTDHRANVVAGVSAPPTACHRRRTRRSASLARPRPPTLGPRITKP